MNLQIEIDGFIMIYKGIQLIQVYIPRDMFIQQFNINEF